MCKVSIDVSIHLVNWKHNENEKYLPLDCSNQIWTPDIHDIKNQRVLLHTDIIEPLRMIRDGEFEYFLMISFFFFLCLVHVKYLLLLSFVIAAEFYNLGRIEGIIRKH